MFLDPVIEILKYLIFHRLHAVFYYLRFCAELGKFVAITYFIVED